MLAQPAGHLAIPPADQGRPVLVLHAWWGLNDTIKAVDVRLADAGFIAFAPDLYHGQVATDMPGAETLAKAIDANSMQAKAEIAHAAKFLSQRAGVTGQKLAVIGFSLGAYYALDLAATQPDLVDSVVLFYGTGDAGATTSRAAYLGHFAESDPFESPAGVDALESALRQAGRPVEFHRYPGTGHWFFEPDRKDAFNPAAASLAWERTLAFLNRRKT